MKIIRILILGVLFFAFPRALLAQTTLDLTLDDFKGQKFADVQKKAQTYIDECLSFGVYNRLPQFGDSFQDQEYQVILNQAKTETCENENWNDDLKRHCMRTLVFHIKTEEGFQKFLKDARKLGVNSKSAQMAQAIFYKDPSICPLFLQTNIFEESSDNDKRVSYFICQAITTPAGINACTDNLGQEPELLNYCTEGYWFYHAAKTKNMSECEKISIRDDMLKLQCEILVDPSNVEKKVIKHYTESQCYKAFAIPLAVVGILDPMGPDQAKAYCYKIKEYHPVDFKKCQELVHQAEEYQKESEKKN